MDTSRTVSFTNYSPERLSARYDARSWQFFAEAGYKVQVGGLMLEPFASVSHTGLATDGFSETGGDAALTSSSDTDNTTFTTLGMHGAMVLLDTVHERGMAGWRHAFGDADPSSTHTLSGSSPFTVTGAPTTEDAVVTEFGIEDQPFGQCLSRRGLQGPVWRRGCRSWLQCRPQGDVLGRTARTGHAGSA